MPCTLPASLADAAVCRGSFHAVLGGEAEDTVFADFSAALQKAQAEGRILTASLFRYENHLFFYAEGQPPVHAAGALPRAGRGAAAVAARSG